MLTVYVSQITLARLQQAEKDNGLTVAQMAEAAIENTMADYFRHRSDDPDPSEAI